MKKEYFIIIILFFLILKVKGFEQTGNASWYGPNFHGRKTANGEIFNTEDFTAAHRTLAFGSIVRITSLVNNKSTVARINDRGPFKENRIIDLSKACAEELDMIKNGIINVKIELLEKGSNRYHRYSYKKKYLIQLASFNDIVKAESMMENLSTKNFSLIIKKVSIEHKCYYRLVIENLNYYELQKYRVKLHKEGLNSYLIIPS